MPTYEYKCGDCGEKFDRFQKMHDDAVTQCPACGGAVTRLISGGGGFIIKGKHGGRGTACGQSEPCCGRGEPCGGSGGCH